MKVQYRGGYHTPDSVYPTKLPGNTVICLIHPTDGGGSWLAECYSALPAPLRRDLIVIAQPNPLALLSVARSPSRNHYWPRWWALTPPFQPLPSTQQPYQAWMLWREFFLLRL